MYEVNFDSNSLNTEELSIAFYHYNYSNAQMHFEFNEEANAVRASYISFDKKELVVGVKINVESVSNGFIAKCSGKTTICSDGSDLDNLIRSLTYKDVRYTETLEKITKEYDIDFVDMDETLLKVNVAYEASA